MTEDAPFLPGLSPVAGKKVHVAFDGGRLTSDAGVLVLAAIERKLVKRSRIRGSGEKGRIAWQERGDRNRILLATVSTDIPIASKYLGRIRMVLFEMPGSDLQILEKLKRGFQKSFHNDNYPIAAQAAGLFPALGKARQEARAQRHAPQREK